MVRPGRHLRPGQRVTIDDDLSVVIESEAAGRGRPAPGPSAVRTARHRRRARALRPRAAAALHPPPRPRRGPRALPDRVRARARQRRRADRGAALHARRCSSALRARGVETAEVVLHVGPGTFRPVTADDVRGPSRPRGAVRRSRPRPRRRWRGAGARRARGRGGHHRRCARWRPRRRAGTAWPRRDGRDRPRDRARLPLPRGGRAGHQLPPAALDAAAAGVRVRRPRARARGLRGGGARRATASTATATRCSSPSLAGRRVQGARNANRCFRPRTIQEAVRDGGRRHEDLADGVGGDQLGRAAGLEHEYLAVLAGQVELAVGGHGRRAEGGDVGAPRGPRAPSRLYPRRTRRERRWC